MISLYALIEMRELHPNFGKPLYIGIGNTKRPRTHFRLARTPQGCPNRLLNLALRDHFALGLEPRIDILSEHATKAEADAAEQATIAVWGRLGRDADGILCNVAKGGQGPDPALLNDPEILAKISAAASRYWADPAARQRHADCIRAKMAEPSYRSAHGKAVKKALHDPDNRGRHLAGLKRANASMSSDQRSAYAAKKSEDGKARSTAALIASHADPVTQAKRAQNSREPAKNSWADPEIRAKRIAAMKGKKKTMTPEAIAARQANAKAPKSEEALAAQRAALDRSRADPETEARRRASQSAAWEDPEKRARMLAGRAAGIAKSWENPETRERRIAGIKARKHDAGDHG